MKKGKTTKLLAVCLTAALLSGCGKSGGDQPSAASVETAAQEAAPQTDREQDGETAAGETDFQIGERPSLIARKGQEGEAVTAAVEPYAIEADLGNVQNLEQFCAQTVVQQAVEGADEEAGVELRAEVVEDEQVGPGKIGRASCRERV